MTKWTDEELSQLANACCECDGGGPDDPHTCGACHLYHEVLRHRETLRQLLPVPRGYEEILRAREPWLWSDDE